MKNDKLTVFAIGFTLSYVIISLFISGGIFVSPLDIINWLWFMMAFGYWVPEIIALIVWLLIVLALCSLGGFVTQKTYSKILTK